MSQTFRERVERRRARFTLLELLVVIGIMLILMTVAVPGFRRLVTGKAVNSAASMLSGQLALARAAAISEQRYIAVIMPGANFNAPDNAEDSDGNVNEQYHFRSYRIGVVEKVSGNQFKLVEWYPDSKWTFLPTGVVLAECNDRAIASVPPTGEPTPESGVELYGVRDHRVVNVSGWLTDNTLNGDQASNSCYVIDGDEAESRLVEGKSHANFSNSARCVVFSPKGRCYNANGAEVMRYITLVEGNVTKEGSVYKLTEAEIGNMQVLRIYGMSGHCEFVRLGEPVSGGGNSGGGGSNSGGK